MAYTAKTQADVAENLQLFFVLQKRYPTNMDSLVVDGATALYLPQDLDGDGNQDIGLPDSGPHLDRVLALSDGTDAPALTFSTDSTGTRRGHWRSFTRSGFEAIRRHDVSLSDQSNISGTIQQTLSGSTPIPMAIVDPDSGNADAQGFLAQLFPNSINDNGTPGDTSDDFYQVPDGGAVVALGLGPNSSCIPTSMLNAPLYPGCDGSYYGHYVALFLCYENGERATLVGVCDSYGRLPIYSIQQFNESLPNNSRRG